MAFSDVWLSESVGEEGQSDEARRWFSRLPVKARMLSRRSLWGQREGTYVHLFTGKSAQRHAGLVTDKPEI